jgi:signal transduction histidine kinase
MPRRPRLHVSLTTKANVLVSLLIVVTSLTLSLALIRQASKQIFSEYVTGGSSLAMLLARSCQYGLMSGNTARLSEQLSDVLDQPHVVYVQVVDGSGDPVIDHCADRMGGTCPTVGEGEAELLATIGTATVQWLRCGPSGERVYDISVPVVVTRRPARREELSLRAEDRPADAGTSGPTETGERHERRYEEVAFGPVAAEGGSARNTSDAEFISEQVGTVHLGISTADLAVMIARTRRTAGALTLGVILVGVFLTLTFIRMILRPVKQLAEVTEEIRAGNLSLRVQISSHDEIGELASSFNQMLDRLQEWQGRLVQSERWATVGHFAGSLAHELRNPLGVIRNSRFFIESRIGSDEKVMRHLKLIDEEVEMANTIVTGLLTFSRLSEPKKRPGEINAMVRRAVERSRISEGVNITLNLSSDLPPVMIDQAQIERVFLALISNADQAIEGTGTIGISTRGSWLADEIHHRRVPAVEIAFVDTGCGISPEIQEKIFEPLFSTKARGMGLGLSVAKAIIEGHRGTIEVRKGGERGARFMVTLPIRGIGVEERRDGQDEAASAVGEGAENGRGRDVSVCSAEGTRKDPLYTLMSEGVKPEPQDERG